MCNFQNKLVNFLMSWIAGCEHLNLQQVRAKIGFDNEASIKMFTKHGFKEVGQYCQTIYLVTQKCRWRQTSNVYWTFAWDFLFSGGGMFNLRFSWKSWGLYINIIFMLIENDKIWLNSSTYHKLHNIIFFPQESKSDIFKEVTLVLHLESDVLTKITELTEGYREEKYK